VDMGAGKQSTQENYRLISTGRKPKKWYSPIFFGRLGKLRGAIGYQMSEQVIQSIRQELDV